MTSDWTELPLGELADIVGGGTPPTNDPECFDGNIPWITPKDLSGIHSRYVNGGERSLSRKGLENSSAKLLPANSVLLTTRAPIGYLAIAADQITTNQGFRSLIVKSGYSHEFVYYWLKTNIPELELHSSGSTFKEISGSALAQIRMRVPPLPEQRRIAHILGTLDDKIENNRKTAKTLESMAQAIFKSWFVDFDPVRAKMAGESRESICKRLKITPEILNLFPYRLVDSELGEIPEGWDVGVFGNLVDYLRDQENPLSYPEVTFHHFSIPAFDEGKMPKVELGKTIKSLKLLVPENVVLLSKLNPEINRVWLVDLTISNRAVCSTEFLVLRAKPPFTRSYIYLFARSEFFREKIEGLVTGTSRSHQRAQVGPISGIPALLPVANVIDAFNSFTDKLLLRTLECRRELTGLTKIRDTLLPKIISGEIRVPEAEDWVEGALP